ncbi:MAG TPA: hypothetical protein PJ988_15775 [Anaerolinea sp.]|nr:hypothetical protein [Anaerolinea sp.]
MPGNPEPWLALYTLRILFAGPTCGARGTTGAAAIATRCARINSVICAVCWALSCCPGVPF